MNKKTFRESEHISAEYATRKGPQRRYRARTLDNSCPVLHDFLKPGMKVLDMKCGQGTITLDVARQVRRGSVVGMDPNEKALANTRAAAEEANLENVEFRAGYTHSIDFPDGTFDLVYSHALLSWLQEPVKALREQARVARSGAWVVTMTRSYDYLVLYPECPELRRIMTALGALKEAPEDVGFFNAFNVDLLLVRVDLLPVRQRLAIDIVPFELPTAVGVRVAQCIEFKLQLDAVRVLLAGAG